MNLKNEQWFAGSGPGQNQDPDAVSTRIQKGLGRSIAGGTRGKHIIHQKDMFAFDPVWLWADKGPGQILFACLMIKAGLADRCPDPDKAADINVPWGRPVTQIFVQPGKISYKEPGLIEPALFSL